MPPSTTNDVNASNASTADAAQVVTTLRCEDVTSLTQTIAVTDAVFLGIVAARARRDGAAGR